MFRPSRAVWALSRRPRARPRAGVDAATAKGAVKAGSGDSDGAVPSAKTTPSSSSSSSVAAKPGWKAEEGGAVQRHFKRTSWGKTLEVKHVGGERGIEHGADSEAKKSSNILRRMLDAATVQRLGPVGAWLQTIRFLEWRGIAHTYYPALWGVGFGCTQVMVFEAADMAVLNMPFMPIHLVGQFLIAAWNAHCFNNIYDDLVRRRVCGLKPSNPLSDAASVSTGLMHGGFAYLIIMNMHPLAPQFCAALLPLALAYPVIWNRTPIDSRKRLFLRQLHRGLVANAGAVCGYVAVVGRLDPTALVPLYIGAIFWTLMYDNIDLLAKEAKTTSLTEVPYFAQHMKDGLPLLLPPFLMGIGIASYTVGQSALFLPLWAASGYYMFVQLDSMNLSDTWSMQQTAGRCTRMGTWMLASIMLGNMIWAWVLYTFDGERGASKELQAPTVENLKGTTMGTVLRLNAIPAERLVVDGEVPFLERVAKPALVYEHIMRQQRIARGDRVPTAEELEAKNGSSSASSPSSSEEEEDVYAAAGELGEMPAYMRRERIVSNLGSVARYCIPEERMQRYERWWYGFSDHYNLV